MKILFLFLIFSSNIIAQNRKVEIFKETFVKLVIEPKIDYTKSIEDETKGINFNENSISPNFAIELYNNQNNRFSYKNYIFYWNDIPINLFEEMDVIKGKFPKMNLIEKEKSLELSRGVNLYFFEYNGKKFLKDISITLRNIYNPQNNDFGIFLIEGFPLNGKTYQDNEFSVLLEKLNQKSGYNFNRSRSYTYSTAFKKVDFENMEIFENYFDTEKFRRTKNKNIESQIIMTQNNISFTNDITYIGIDSQNKYVYKEAPTANVEQEVIDKENLIYSDVDSKAEFPGGENEFDKYFRDKISNCEGKLQDIIAKFVVEKDGYISNLILPSKNSNDKYYAEIQSIIKKMPKWIPAKKDGKVVRSLVEKKININK